MTFAVHFPYQGRRQEFLDRADELRAVLVQPPQRLIEMSREHLGEAAMKEILYGLRLSGDSLRHDLGTEFALKEEKADDQDVCPADMRSQEFWQLVIFRKPEFEGDAVWLEEVTQYGTRRDSIDVPGRAHVQDAMDCSSGFCDETLNLLHQVAVMFASLDDGVPRLGLIYRPFVGDMFSGNGEETWHVDHTGRETQIVLPDQFTPDERQLLFNRAGRGFRHGSGGDELRGLFPHCNNGNDDVTSGTAFPFVAWLEAQLAGRSPSNILAAHEDHLFRAGGELLCKRAPCDRVPEWILAKGAGAQIRRLSDGALHGVHAETAPHVVGVPKAMDWLGEQLGWEGLT